MATGQLLVTPGKFKTKSTLCVAKHLSHLSVTLRGLEDTEYEGKFTMIVCICVVHMFIMMSIKNQRPLLVAISIPVTSIVLVQPKDPSQSGTIH